MLAFSRAQTSLPLLLSSGPTADLSLTSLRVQITFLGLCIIFVNFGTLLYYDPGFKCESGGAKELPRWVYFSSVLVLPQPRTHALDSASLD